MNEHIGRPAVEQDRGAHDRAPRESLVLMGQLSIEGEGTTVSVRIRNLSATGMMAELADPPQLGAHATIEMRNIGLVHGTIAWARGGKFGMHFDIEIDPMEARKPVGTAPRAPEFARPPPGYSFSRPK